MGATKATFTKNGGWGRTMLYQASWKGTTINVEVTRVKDKRGTLNRAESSLTGLIESYSWQEIKDVISDKLKLQQAGGTKNIYCLMNHQTKTGPKP